MEEYNSGYSPEYSTKANSKVKMILLVLLIIAALISVSALAVINFFPEVVFSLMPKNMYLFVENQAKGDFEKDIQKILNDADVKDLLTISETPYKDEMELTFKIKTDNLTGAEADQIKKVNELLLIPAKLVLSENTDYKNEQIRQKISLIYQNNKMLEADMFMNKERVGISVPTIYNKYFTVNIKDLAPVWEKFGQTTGPKKLVTNMDIIKAIKIDKKELESIINDYAKFYADFIKDDEITFTKGVEIETSEGKIKCNQITLKLTEQRAKDLVVALAEKMSNDDKLLNMTAGNFINVMKLYEDAGYFEDSMYGSMPEEFKDINKIKEKMKESIEEMKKQPVDGKTDFLMSLYINGSYDVLERKFEIINNDQEKGGRATLTFGNYKLPTSKSQNGIVEFVFEDKGSDEKTTMKFNNVESLQNGKTKLNTITFEGIQKSGDTVGDLFKAKVDMTTDEDKDGKTNITAKYDISFIPGTDSKSSKIYGELKSVETRDDGKKSYDYKYDIDVNLKSDEMAAVSGNGEIGFLIGLNGKVQRGVPVEMPNLDASNNVDLNTVSQEQLMSEFQAIQGKVMEFAEQYKDLFNQLTPVMN